MPVTQQVGKFNPLHIPDCALWLEADRGVTVTGSGVSLWADQSGNGRNATQGTDGARPTVVADGIGGRPSLSFDATDDFLDLTATSANIARNITGITSIGVFKFEAGSNNLRAILAASTGTGAGAGRFTAGTAPTANNKFGSRIRALDADGGGAPEGSSVDSNNNILVISMNYTSGIIQAYLNGSVMLNEAVAGITLGATSNTNSLAVQIGRFAANSPFNGKLALDVVYQRVLSTTERQRIERFYGNKYGITVA